MKVIAIIPARYNSTRFPGKPLVKIGNKSMIQLVHGQVLKANEVDEVFIATDDERIFKHVKSFTSMVKMTVKSHLTGTDRCAEVAAELNGDIIINVQGDEPFIHPQQINRLAKFLKTTKHIEIATLIKKIENTATLFNPNVVKVVCSNKKEALYFSRQAIPFIRGKSEKEWLSCGNYYKHIGMYAFRKNTLLQLAQLKDSQLEKMESLEQLRWLENGLSIGVIETNIETKGIDTPQDLEKLLNP